MAKYTLECPKCGSLNTPPSSLKFWQKELTCVTCNTLIDIKQSRMVSKICPNPNCGKVIVCDQKKLDGKRCPSCGTKLKNSATAEFSYAEVSCPQCNCLIEIDKTKEIAECPICDKVIDIKEVIAKENLVTSTGISVIKYEGDNSTFVWKHPIEDFNFGSQLIVHESQEAIFMYNGQALDLFPPGKYSLETDSIPMLKNVADFGTGNQKPFHAEVYFINKTVQMGIKWGTDSRVRFIEPNTGIPLDIGASGELNLQVSDARKLLVKLVGTTGGLSRSEIMTASQRNVTTPNEREATYDPKSGINLNDNSRNIENNKLHDGWASTLRGYFRPLIMTTVKTHLASTIKTERINILEIDENLEMLSNALRDKVTVGFEEYGLFVPQFFVTNVALPEEDRNFKKIRELMAASYIGVKEAETEADIIAARRKKILEEEATKLELEKMQAEKMRIQAQAEADRMTITGSAENLLRRQEGLIDAEVMQAKGYDQKDVLQAEVQKAYAEGIGMIGSNAGNNSGGNGGGNMISDILGLSVGLSAMGTVTDKVSDVMKGVNSGLSGTVSAKDSSSDDSSWKCSCGCIGNHGKFCSECGKAKPETWDCPDCGTKNNTGKFCSGCGTAKPETWECPHCKATGNTGKFCSECGKSKDVTNDTWDCECGNKGITGKFCSECGNKKPDAVPSDTWDCECGNKKIKGKFCTECGMKKPEKDNFSLNKENTWDCECGSKGNESKFCAECGKIRPDASVTSSEANDTDVVDSKVTEETPEEITQIIDDVTKLVEDKDTWDCKCGNKNIKTKFCFECGAPRGEE